MWPFSRPDLDQIDLHLQFWSADPERPYTARLTLDGIAFNVDREIWPNPNVRWVELAYKLDVNEYQGRESVQLMVAHLAPR